MDFFSTAKARLVAMRTLLEDTVAGDRQRVSEQQTIAMTTLVAKLPSNDQQAAEAFAAEALALVHGMNHLLRMEDSDAIILALADLAAPKKSKKWTMQNYQAVLSFFHGDRMARGIARTGFSLGYPTLHVQEGVQAGVQTASRKHHEVVDLLRFGEHRRHCKG